MQSFKIAGRNWLSSWLLFAAVALAPLPFGSTDRPVIAIWCGILGLAVVFASLRELRPRQLLPLLALAVVFVGYLFVLYEQLADHPLLAIAPHPAWDQAAGNLHEALPPSISAVRDEPFFAIGTPLAAMLAFAASFIVCSDRRRANQILEVIAWSGVAYAVIGIALFVLDPSKVLWREKLAYTSSLTATFVNRNTAAVYFGSCAIVCLLFLFRALHARSGEGVTMRQAWAAAILLPARDVVQPFLMFLVCFTAMLMTASRAGIVFSFVGLVIAFAAFHRRRWRPGGGLLIAFVAASIIAFASLQLLGGGVGNRFNENGLVDAARIETYRSTLKLIADHPWFGTGLGTFEWTFPAYRSDVGSIWGIWNRAHNSLLEIAAEMGVPMAVAVAVAWALALWQLGRGVARRRRDLAVVAAALAAAVVGLLHSLVNFSLQIPRYAIVIFALVGAGIAQSYPSEQRSKSLR